MGAIQIPEEKPPYKDPFLFEPGECPGIPFFYMHKYTREILDMRNWMEERKQKLFDACHCVNFQDIEELDVFSDDVYKVMKKSLYFTGEREWMANPDCVFLIHHLIETACHFKGGSPR